MWGECYHQNIVTPLETTLPSVDEVYARFASPPCSWRPFLSGKLKILILYMILFMKFLFHFNI